VAIAEQKPPPIRQDLEIVPQYYRGELTYMAKDPVTLDYYRLGEEEYVVVKCFQRGMGVEQTQQEVKRLTGAEIPTMEIYKFASQLQNSNLLKSKGMEDVRRLARNKRLRRAQKLKQVLSNYLFITIPLWDPDRVLNRLLPYFRKLLNYFWLSVWVVVAGAALWIIVDNFSVLVTDAFSLLGGWNLLILSIVLFTVKFVHEMGHALTCKHFGGEVHAIGPALLIFQPMMFTDASDAWLFPSKWDRILVTAAGIIVEIFLASVAAIVWITSEPGMVKQVAYTMMMVCSISTVMFNANPLLRFDGYYVLSDLLEIPNLRIKTGRYLSYLFDRYFLGIKTERPAVEHQAQGVFLTYGIARFCYRLILVVSIGFILYSIFEPLGIFMWLTTFYGMILGPVWKRGRNLARQYRTGGVRVRYLFIVAATIAAGVALWFVPIDYTVQAPCVVAPTRLSHVRTSVPGRVAEVLVCEGDEVKAGAPLVRMENPEVDLLLAQVEDRLAQMQRQEDAARAMGDGTGEKIARAQKAKLAEEKANLLEQKRRLVLTAPHDGVVVTVDRRHAGGTTPLLYLVPPLSGGREAIGPGAYQGMTLKPGTAVLGIASAGDFRLEMFVYQYNEALLEGAREVEVKAGSPVQAVLASHPSVVLESYVESKADVNVRDIKNVDLTLLGLGEIPVKPSSGGAMEPLKSLYLVRSAVLSVDSPAGPGLHWGVTGKANIVYGRGPVGRYFFNRVKRGLKLRMQEAGISN